MIDVRSFTGTDAAPFFDDVARLRIDGFRAFPYLYDGDIGYERRYLATYAQAPESLFVLAFDGPRIVGAATGMPLTQETEAVRAPWIEAGIDSGTVFYFGESVLQPAHRGKGLGHRFFDERENYASRLARFKRASFCAVERESDHPRRPADYRSLHAFWESRGYRRHPELHCRMDWKDIDTEGEVSHRLTFWSRPLPLD